MSRRVVITGVGAVTPLGVGAGRLHERWRDGESGIEDGLARAREFDATEFMSAKEARRTDRFTQLAVAAAQEAIENAGWADGPPYEPDAVGCVIGTGIGGLGTIEDAHDVLRDNGPGAGVPADRPADDGQRRLRRPRHASRAPGPGVRRGVGVRRRRACDRREACA